MVGVSKAPSTKWTKDKEHQFEWGDSVLNSHVGQFLSTC